MRILLIEDDHAIASVIRLGLKAARYTVEVAADGPTGLKMALEDSYALIILDLMLPGADGWSICATLRERRCTTPILILTARDAPEDRVRGLDLGADDYLPKPFHFPELLARVQALVRRNQTHKARVIRVADLEIDTTTGRTVRAGREIHLTRPEFCLLELLAGNEGRVMSCRALGEQLGEENGGGETLQMDIETLRQKIDDAYPDKLILTVGSVGYLMQAPVPTCPTAAAA